MSLLPKAKIEPENDPLRQRTPVISSAAESTLRVDVTLLNRMMNLVGELVLTRNQVLAGHLGRSQHDPAQRAAWIW